MSNGHQEPNVWDLDKRLALLEQAHERIADDLSSIDKSLKRLVWVIITAVVGAAMKLLLTGSVAGLS